jgi:hypothetical protein
MICRLLPIWHHLLIERQLLNIRDPIVDQDRTITEEIDMKTLVTTCTFAAVALVSSSPVWSQAVLPELKKQPSAQAVLNEHFDALNHCDWNRIVAQYPDDAQINLPGGTIVKGRNAIGDMFAGLCKAPKDGGLKGITFKAEQSTTIGDVFVTQWVATAPFLAEPYKGSDAYITKDGYMQAMVTTFDGTALKMRK